MNLPSLCRNPVRHLKVGTDQSFSYLRGPFDLLTSGQRQAPGLARAAVTSDNHLGQEETNASHILPPPPRPPRSLQRLGEADTMDRSLKRLNGQT